MILDKLGLDRGNRLELKILYDGSGEQWWDLDVEMTQMELFTICEYITKLTTDKTIQFARIIHNGTIVFDSEHCQLNRIMREMKDYQDDIRNKS